MRIMNKGIFPFVVVVAELLKFKDNLRKRKEKEKKLAASLAIV